MEQGIESFNIDLITTGIGKMQKDDMRILTSIIREICKDTGSTAPLEEIVTRAHDEGIERETVEKLIPKMRINGIIYEPRHGHYSVS